MIVLIESFDDDYLKERVPRGNKGKGKEKVD
jgi:hypothetical protein